MSPKTASLVLTACLLVVFLTLFAIMVWPLTIKGAATLTILQVVAVAIGYHASNRI